MPGLINLQVSDNPGNRDDEVVDYIVHKTLEPRENDEYFIIDPFLDADGDIFEHFKLKNFEGSLWSYIINEICISMDRGTINILTGEQLRRLSERVSFTSNSNYPLIIPHPDTKLSNCQINVARYKIRPGNNTVPNKLHDRWILKKPISGNNVGIHIGPSLGDIKGKDATITLFDDSIIQKAMDRFAHIWYIAGQSRAL